MNKSLWICLLIAISGFASAIQKREADLARDMPFMMVYRFQYPEQDCKLLLKPDVQQDLKLSDSETILVKALYDRARAAIEHVSGEAGPYERDGKKAEFDADADKARGLIRDFEDQCLKMLGPNRAERLYELTVQAKGGEMLLYPTTVDKLKMTPAELERFHKLHMDVLHRRAKEDAANGPVPGRKYSEAEWKAIVNRSREISANCRREIDALPAQVLTERQLRIWRSLGGAPLPSAAPKNDEGPPPQQ
ncbi:MAG TPA: hypothetical protein VHE55_18950 [Fimbriimonadaceae bacterium]|nr:hypothetical protein [Fimbriimonadaceae bacterium]